MQRKSAKLVDRARELTALMRVLRVPGLVTVGGPPGVGKTALARCCTESWGGPSWVVDLTEARGVDEMAVLVARALTLRGRAVSGRIGRAPAENPACSWCWTTSSTLRIQARRSSNTG